MKSTTGQILSALKRVNLTSIEREFVDYAYKLKLFKDFEVEAIRKLYEKYHTYYIIATVPCTLTKFELESLESDVRHLIKKRGLQHEDRVNIYDSYQVAIQGRGFFTANDKPSTDGACTVRRSKGGADVSTTSGGRDKEVQKDRKSRIPRKRS